MSLLKRLEQCIALSMTQMEEDREWQCKDTRRLAKQCKQVFLEWSYEKRQALAEGRA